MSREITELEEKILTILFKDKVITEILVDYLLPEIMWTIEAKRDYNAEKGYQVARENLGRNLKRMLNETTK